MKLHFDTDQKGQLYAEWEQAEGIYKRAWIQRKDDRDKDWANTGCYLNVARVEAPGKGPAGNATDFPVYNDTLTDKQLLSAFVYSVCAITGVALEEESSFAENDGLTADDFRKKLEQHFLAAEKEKQAFVDIMSRDLHHELGGYPGPNHRMPVCCDVMYRARQEGDSILSAPAKGKGASLVIRYQLPRNKAA